MSTSAPSLKQTRLDRVKQELIKILSEHNEELQEEEAVILKLERDLMAARARLDKIAADRMSINKTIDSLPK